MDGIFLSKVDKPQEADATPVVKSGPTPSVTNVEVPYTDYESQKAHPFMVDYFKLGDTWNSPTGGFPEEISYLENYMRELVNSGDIANSVTAVQNKLKEMEKANNLTKEERTVVKIETLAAYAKFMSKKNDIKNYIRRYGTKH